MFSFWLHSQYSAFWRYSAPQSPTVMIIVLLLDRFKMASMSALSRSVRENVNTFTLSSVLSLSPRRAPD